MNNSGYNKNLWGSIILLLLILVLMFAFYTNRFLYTGVYIGEDWDEPEDVLEHDIPLATFYMNAIKKGYFPLWNPHKVCGINATETPFMGPLYPLFLLYFLLPMGWAINSGFLIHIFISAVFMALLCRSLGMKYYTTIFCTISWAFCSVFQQCSLNGWLPETVSNAFLPAALYMFIEFQKANNKEKLVFLILAGLFLGLCTTGGHLSYSFITVSCVLLFMIPELKRLNNIPYFVLFIALILLLTVAIWGPVLYQNISYPSNSVKEITYANNLDNMFDYLAPFSGQYAFIGRIAFILGIIGIGIAQHKYALNLRILGITTIILSFGIIRKILPDFMPQVVRYFYTWQTGFIFALIIFSGIMLEKLVKLLNNKFPSKALFHFVFLSVIILQLADLYWFNMRFYPRRFDFTITEYLGENRIIEYLKKDKSLFRVISFQDDSPAMRINQNLIYGIDCFNALIKGNNLWPIKGESKLSGRVRIRNYEEVADLCNIKYVIMSRSAFREDTLITKVIFDTKIKNNENLKIDDYVLLENKKYLPRAFCVFPQGDSKFSDVLYNKARKPLTDIRVDDDLRKQFEVYSKVKIERYKNSYRIEFDSRKKSFLFFSEMYHWGWNAKLDGKPVEIFRPLGFFMGIDAPSGKHHVEFKFQPTLTITFYIVTLATFLCSIILLLILRRVKSTKMPK
ncbi:YfhO family protein [bacterium]|nr:YfhO family protein [bacterium]